MLRLRPLLSRLSLATKSNAPKLLKGKTIHALINGGVEANWVIGTCKFSVKTDLDGDDEGCDGGGGGSSIKESNAFIKESNEEADNSERLAKDYNTEDADKLDATNELLIKFPHNHGLKTVEMYNLFKENPEIYTLERLAKDFGVSTAAAHVALFAAYSSQSILWSKSPTSDCLESHRPPLTDAMKEALANWRADINSTRKRIIPDKELFKKYKKAMALECSDDK